MTDRYCGFAVTLERDMRDDDVEKIKLALQLIKGVISVKPVLSELSKHMAYEQARNEIAKKLFKVLR